MMRVRNILAATVTLGFLFACATTPQNTPGSTVKAPRSENVVADCVSATKTADTSDRKFQCKDFKGRTFSATCNLSTDPVEFGIGAVQIDRAKWAKYGENEGIEGKFGFIACRKQVESQTPKQ